MASRIPNFRGHHAAILHPADANRTILIEQLIRLGLNTEVIWPPQNAIPENIDVIFFDADRGPTAMMDQAWTVSSPPLIAISGTEAPGTLETLLELKPSSVLNKPIRREVVFKALVFAFHYQSLLQKTANKMAFLSQQVKARSLVFKTTLLVMRRFNVDDDEAYAVVRRASMSNNLLVEAFAFLLISDPDHYMHMIEREITRSKSKAARIEDAQPDRNIQ